MPLINCKAEPKLKETKYCVLSSGDNVNVDEDDANKNNKSFLIEKTQKYPQLLCRYFCLLYHKLCFIFINFILIIIDIITCRQNTILCPFKF